MERAQEIPRYAQLFVEGLKEAGVTIATAVPESMFKTVYRLLEEDPGIFYIQAANEAEMPGIAAGAYLGGKRAVMLMENSGIRQACEPIARFSFSHQIPMVMIMPFRGELGERNWWGHNHGQTMEPILNALRIPYWWVRRLDEIKPALRRAQTHIDTSQWPVALIFTGECAEVLPYEKD